MIIAADSNTISAIAAVTAALVSVVAIVVAARGLRHSRDSSAASQRSADAAETSAEAARLSAEAAERTALAEESMAAIEAERWAVERELRSQAELTAAEIPKRAVLTIRTEHRIAQNRTFGSPDGGHEYFLVVDNTGGHKASNIGIQIAGCNGSGEHDFPATAEPSALCPRESLLPQRSFAIRLHSSGNRNCWDIAECVVRWEDGLGTHDERLSVARNW